MPIRITGLNCSQEGLPTAPSLDRVWLADKAAKRLDPAGHGANTGHFGSARGVHAPSAVLSGYGRRVLHILQILILHIPARTGSLHSMPYVLRYVLDHMVSATSCEGRNPNRPSKME